MNPELVDQLTAYSAIFTMAVVPIWVGSHLSLNQKGMESMSSEDAWKFPFIGSGVLFGLYILFKTFSKEYVNLLLTAYFLLFGILAVSATLSPVFAPLFSKKQKPWKISWKPFWKSKDPYQLEFGKADIVSLIVASAIGAWYVSTKHWISNNVLGLSFSIQGVAMLSLGSYKVGCILLGGLFFYDIFWVFGTDVMVTVAKSFDAPVKLLFPKHLFAETLEFSMLGLGDIVIPGIFIALLLRFDVNRAKNKKAVSKLYFYVCYISYFIGLVTTIAVMHIFKAAQPALLYLVPACVGSSTLLALIRGEMGTLLAYTEEQPKATEKPKSG
jgi:minor histocompatibility antigen H13